MKPLEEHMYEHEAQKSRHYVGNLAQVEAYMKRVCECSSVANSTAHRLKLEHQLTCYELIESGLSRA